MFYIYVGLLTLLGIIAVLLYQIRTILDNSNQLNKNITYHLLSIKENVENQDSSVDYIEKIYERTERLEPLLEEIHKHNHKDIYNILESMHFALGVIKYEIKQQTDSKKRQ